MLTSLLLFSNYSCSKHFDVQVWAFWFSNNTQGKSYFWFLSLQNEILMWAQVAKFIHSVNFDNHSLLSASMNNTSTMFLSIVKIAVLRILKLILENVEKNSDHSHSLVLSHSRSHGIVLNILRSLVEFIFSLR